MVAIHMLLGLIFTFTGFQAELTSLANSVTRVIPKGFEALEHPSLMGRI